MSEKKYKKPIIFDDILKQDLAVQAGLEKQFNDEILYFKLTSELFISFFSNSKRLYRDPTEVDYIQLIAVRIFQDTRSALILTLYGLYPQAISLIRGVLESINLIYDFKINPKHEDIWSNGGKNKRKRLFKTSEVRKRVEGSKICNLKPSTELFGLISNYSVHTNFESHIWYLELDDKRLLYHWAGQKKDDVAMVLIFSVLSSLSQALFVLTYEDLYGLDKFWVEDFTEWKKKGLSIHKKVANLLGIDHYNDVEIKQDKIIFI